MSAFYPFRGGGSPKADIVRFFYRFLIGRLPLGFKVNTTEFLNKKFDHHGMWKDQSESDTPRSIMISQAERIAFMVGSSFIWMLVKIHWSLGVTNL